METTNKPQNTYHVHGKSHSHLNDQDQTRITEFYRTVFSSTLRQILIIIPQVSLFCSKIPSWLKTFAPANALSVQEQSWNAYPKSKTGSCNKSVNFRVYAIQTTRNKHWSLYCLFQWHWWVRQIQWLRYLSYSCHSYRQISYIYFVNLINKILLFIIWSFKFSTCSAHILISAV